ncbi:hypothetical protein F5883DRAFT_148616 [Diaporthe sp. PMI_573]|nr:hypothetical protein F5883DRAFT_148616 [Diaporthaceae sp. PMI_573]
MFSWNRGRITGWRAGMGCGCDLVALFLLPSQILIAGGLSSFAMAHIKPWHLKGSDQGCEAWHRKEDTIPWLELVSKEVPKSHKCIISINIIVPNFGIPKSHFKISSMLTNHKGALDQVRHVHCGLQSRGITRDGHSKRYCTASTASTRSSSTDSINP